MSNYNQQQQSQSQSQQQQSHSQPHGFVQCITIREFWGDSNLNQLCFKLHTPIEVDFSRPPQNGWQLGRINNLQGWCPEWSITPVGAVVLPSSSLPLPQSQYSRPPHSIIPPHQSQQSRERNSLRRSSDYVTPLQRIVEGNQEDETTNDNDDGLLFDQRTNYIIGGNNVPQAKKITDNNSSSMENHHHHRNDKKNPFENVPDATKTTTTSSNNNNNKWNSGIKKLFSQTKIGIVNNNNNNNATLSSSSYKNPYTQKQDTLERDWTNAPQIVNNENGRIAIVETDGQTTKYKNEAMYQISTTTNEIADQFKTTTSNLSQQISNWKISSPIVLGRSTMNNDNDNDNKRDSNNNQKRQQQDEQQLQKDQIFKVETNNKEQEQRSSTTMTTQKYKFGIMPSSFTFPNIIPKIPRSSSKEQQITTTYCDMNGNEQTLVEDNRRQASHTRMNIYY